MHNLDFKGFFSLFSTCSSICCCFCRCCSYRCYIWHQTQRLLTVKRLNFYIIFDDIIVMGCDNHDKIIIFGLSFLKAAAVFLESEKILIFLTVSCFMAGSCSWRFSLLPRQHICRDNFIYERENIFVMFGIFSF